MKIFTHIHTIGEIKTGNARFHIVHRFSLIYTALIKTFSVSTIFYSKIIRKDKISWNFFYYSFTFYIQLILLAGK